MKPDSEIELARALIHRHGIRAVAVAKEHAAQSVAQNDRQGAAQWAGVARAVEELRSEARAA
jgi:hypothetical protein